VERSCCDCGLVCGRSSLRCHLMACDRVGVGCVSVSGDDESYLCLQLSLWLLLTRVLRGLSLRGTCDARDAEERGMFLSLSNLFDFLGMISGALGDNRMDTQPF
jgi:hypothetical protein